VVNNARRTAIAPACGELATLSGGPSVLRVLTLICRPLNQAELDELGDAWRLVNGLQAVEAPVEIKLVRPPTKAGLREALHDPRGWDVLHFDGPCSASALAAETEEGLCDPISARELADMLVDVTRVPRLVVLTACTSARLAEFLAQRGLPAVIGTREAVTVDFTGRFVGTLYAALGDGRTICNAFEAARSAVRGVPNPCSPTPSEELPTLFGKGIDKPLCAAGPKGKPGVEGDRLYGLPAPAGSGGFYGLFLDGPEPGGRKGLLLRLMRALLRGERLVAVTGMGGIGKSALAAEAARRLAWRFPGGVFWVDGWKYLNTNLTLDAILEPFSPVFGTDFLKLSAGQKEAAVTDYLSHLEQASMIVVDNAHTADEAVRRFLHRIPAPSAALVTLREPPEYGGCIVPVGGMEPEEALYFLVREIRRRKNRPDRFPAAAEEKSLLEMADELEGHPLALLQAAALVETLGVSEALELVQQNLVRGELQRRLDFSYHPLPEGEKELLHRLAAFSADFDQAAVEAICAMAGKEDECPLENWRWLLAELVRRSWVERWEAGGHDRFRLHPLVREYVRRRAGSRMENHDRRMAAYFLFLTDQWRARLDTAEARDAVAMAARERQNLLGGQEAAMRLGLWDWAIEYGYGLHELFYRTTHWADRIRVLKLALKAAEEKGDKRDVAAMAHNLGVALQDGGEYAAA